MRTKQCIDVTFPYGKLETTISGIYQYDYGVQLRVLDVPESNVYQVQFAVDDEQRTTNGTCIASGSDLIITIPDKCLSVRSRNVKCYIYYYTPATGYTAAVINICVIPRAKPTSNQYTPEDHSQFDVLAARLQQIINQTQETEDQRQQAWNQAKQEIEQLKQQMVNESSWQSL